MAASADLGRMVHQVKRMPMRLGIVCMLAAIILGGAGTYFLVATPPNVTAAGTLFALAALALLSLLVLPGQVLRFHERGVVQTEPLAAPRVLPYDAVETLTWSIVWPGLGLTITGDLAGAGQKFEFMVRLLDSASPVRRDLDAVRDRIAMAVAAKALARIQSQQAFEWGSDEALRVRLQRDGLSYRPAKLIGAREEQRVPWTTPLTCVIDNGVCQVVTAGADRAIFAVACAERNFYPGLQVLASMGTVRVA